MFKGIKEYGIIYGIRNTKTNHIYIGQTIRKFETRIREHIRSSYNMNDKFLIHKSIHKHGLEYFEAAIIEDNILITNYQNNKENELDIKEKEYIKKYDTYNKGYNGTKGGKSRSDKNTTLDKIESISNKKALELWNKINDINKISLQELESDRRPYEKRKSKSINKNDVFDVIDIILNTNYSIRAISDYTDINESIIDDINNGEDFNEYINMYKQKNPEAINGFPIKIFPPQERYLNIQTIQDIVHDLLDGKLTNYEISLKNNCTLLQVGRLNKGKSYRGITSAILNSKNDDDIYPIKTKPVFKTDYNEYKESILDIDSVLEIMDLLEKDENTYIYEIAELYNVGKKIISEINMGERYAKYTNPYKLKGRFPLRKKRCNKDIYRPNAQIDESTALEIADLIQYTEIPFIEIADIYEIKPGIVSSINTGFAWSKVTNRHSYPLRHTTLKDEDYLEIAKLLEEKNESIKDIGIMYGISASEVRNINNKKVKEYLLHEFNTPIREKDIEDRLSFNRKIVKLACELLLLDDKDQKEIASMLEVTENLINRINTGKINIKMYDKEYKFPIRKNRLSDDDVKKIAYLLKNTKERFVDIGKKFNITKYSVSNINRHITFDYLLYDFNNPIRPLNLNIRSIDLDENKLFSIVNDLILGEKNFNTIAAESDVSLNTVSRINNHKVYQEYLKKYPNPIRDEKFTRGYNSEIVKLVVDMLNNIPKYKYLKQIAQEVGLCEGTISKINKGEIEPEYYDKEYEFPIRVTRLLDSQIIEIAELLKTTRIPKRKIAHMYSVSENYIQKINKHENRENILIGYDNPIRRTKGNRSYGKEEIKKVVALLQITDDSYDTNQKISDNVGVGVQVVQYTNEGKMESEYYDKEYIFPIRKVKLTEADKLEVKQYWNSGEFSIEEIAKKCRLLEKKVRNIIGLKKK